MNKFISLPLAFLLLTSSAWAATLEVGQPLPALSFEDQHGNSHALDNEVEVIIFTADRDGSKIVEAALEGWTDERLAEHNARYVADISGMPSLITKLFAMPSMQKTPYAILLGQDEAQTQDLPRQEEAVTLMQMDNGQIQSITFVTTPEALTQALEQ